MIVSYSPEAIEALPDGASVQLCPLNSTLSEPRPGVIVRRTATLVYVKTADRLSPEPFRLSDGLHHAAHLRKQFPVWQMRPTQSGAVAEKTAPLGSRGAKRGNANLADPLRPQGDPLFRDRVPEAAARQAAVVLAWLTECQLETLDEMQARRGTAKSSLTRQREICATAVAQCKDLGVSPVGLRGDRCHRLEERLKAGDE